MSTKARMLAVAWLACTVSLSAQERVDEAMVAKIRAEGLERSRALETFTYLTTTIGPRLTNSPAHRRAVEWTQQQLKVVRPVERASRPVGVRPRLVARAAVDRDDRTALPASDRISARVVVVHARGKIAASPVWLPNPTPEALSSAGASLRGAIVMTSPKQDYFIRADRPPASGDLVSDRPAGPRLTREQQSAAAAALTASGVAVTLEPNIGEHGTIFVTGRDAGRQRRARHRAGVRALQPDRAAARAEDPGKARGRTADALLRQRLATPPT